MTGILVLFLLKKRSTPVTKHPPSKFSTLNVCARGLGLTGLAVLLAVNCVPSLDLKNAGDVDIIEDGLSGIAPVA